MGSPSLKLIAGENQGRSAPGALSLESLYERHVGSVYGRCLFLLRDRAEAEDATQEVFARALSHAGGFRFEASPLTWLITIATRHCLNVLRGKGAGWHKQYEEGVALAAAQREKGPDVGPLVRQILGRFDEETQAAAILYHVDEMTLEEVSAALGRSVPTIRKRLVEFARAARAHLENEGATT